MTHHFKSSFTRGGNILTPVKITITDKHVIWKKNRGLDWLYLANDTVRINRKAVTGVTLIDNIIGMTIVIETNGSPSIIAQNFSLSDAEQIQELLT